MLGRREALQTDLRSSYHTLPPTLNASSSSTPSQLAAAVLGGALLAAGLMVVVSRPTELYAAPAVAWKTAPMVQTAPLPALSTQLEVPKPLMEAQPSAVSFGEMMAPKSQASGTLATAAAFLAGCAMAVAAMAFRLRTNVSAPEAPIAMAAVSSVYGHEDLAEVPAFFGKDTDPNSLRRRFEAMLRRGQESIVKAIEECDGEAKFRADAWRREGGGGGVSRVLANGKVWEKAGIGLSVIYGDMPTETINAARQRQAKYATELPAGEKLPFFACGLSCVMHPRNPHCPTMHFNYRYFETAAGDWWFAGGTDITPVYLDEEDMKHFHGVYKKVCDKHDPEFYPKFKKWADEYFLIKHRGETRGLGGIFFDDLNDRDPEKIFAFAEECLNNVVAAYVPIIEKHKNDTFTEAQKRWQLIRRGRYVEFNVIYDRGFIFGLKTGIGRTESIMMTLPEVARWEYNHQPEPGSEEEKILKLFRQPREWV